MATLKKRDIPVFKTVDVDAVNIPTAIGAVVAEVGGIVAQLGTPNLTPQDAHDLLLALIAKLLHLQSNPILEAFPESSSSSNLLLGSLPKHDLALYIKPHVFQIRKALTNAPLPLPPFRKYRNL